MFAGEAESIACPFPVAIVPHHDHDAFAFGVESVENGFGFGGYGAAPDHRFLADGKRLESFGDEVAEIVIIVFAEAFYFFFGFMGE